jgi:V8-like Glu-specific endopeptidase
VEPGSSGSPVLDEALNVVGIHHAGGQLREPATSRRYLRNEGVRMMAILDDFRRNAPDIHARLGS